ncbi:MAG: beta-glucosidase [Acidimicrobiia bacterium]
MVMGFPDGFVWGVATAAHQIEGGNWNNDWWAWEHDPASPCREPSGDAVDSWHRWPEDVALVHELGFGAYRFSVEWSRIEPEDGEFSRAALEHYRRICGALRERQIAPIVTYHHFTSPRWIAAGGGWENPTTADRYVRFAERVTQVLGDLATHVCTFNEPNIVATMGYLVGVFPPGRVADFEARRRVNDVFITAHRRGREAIKAVAPQLAVGLTLSMADYQVVEPGGEAKRDRIRRNMEDVYLEAARGDDFVGVQTYTRALIGPEGQRDAPPGAERTQMGYEFYPEALEGTIRRAWEVCGPTPVLVTENGIGTDDDARRIEYTRRALACVLRCLDDGIDVRGYIHWSLMDNFEWAEGYRPTFGLVAVDRETFERAPKPSAHWLGAIARDNALPGEPTLGA